MDIELKSLIEAGNKTIEALRTDVKADADKVARMEADLANIISQKSALEARLNAVETANARPGAMKGADASLEHKTAFVNYLRKSDDYGVKQTLEAMEAKSIQVGVAADGGYAVPSLISSQIATAVLDLSPVRQLASVVTVGNENYTELLASAFGSGWAGEDDTRTSTSTSAFTQIKPTYGEVYAYPTVSNKSLTDIFFDVESFVIENTTLKFASAEGTAFVSGDGADKPTGLLNGSTISTIATGAAADFGTNPFSNLVDLRFGVKAEYAQNGTFLMNTATFARLVKVVDSTGQHLLQPSVSAGFADSIFGKKVMFDENMPTIAAGAKPILFGDFKRGYLVADIAGMSIIVDKVTLPGYTKFYVSRRVGGIVKDANALKALRIAAS